MLLLGVEIVEVDEDTVRRERLDMLWVEKSAKEWDDTRSFGKIADDFRSPITILGSTVELGVDLGHLLVYL